ncbi:amidohydrolase, partial [Actinomadura coerulea]
MDSSAALNELRKRSADPDRKLLLRGVTVLSMDAEVGDLEEADVLVEGRRIAAIAPRLEVGDEDVLVLELPGHVAIPGLQDTHRHCWQTQLRRMFVDIDGLEGYVDKVHRKIAPCYTPDDMRLGSLLAGLGALDAGITSILDFSHNSRSKAHSDGAIEGWVESGIRAVHASCGPVLGDWEGQWPGDLERLQERHFSSEDQLVTLRMGLLTPQIPGVGEHLEVTREHLEIGRGLGLKITVDAVFGEMAAGRLR